MRERYVSLVWALWIVLSVNSAYSDTWAEVAHVVDGDTIRLKNGQLVRYLGIDAPEINHQTGKAEPFAYASRQFNERHVNGKRVRLVAASSPKDRYGRLLAFVFDTHGRMINRLLILNGLAYYYPLTAPEVHSVSIKLLAAQRHAMDRGIGIWADRKFYRTGPYLGNRKSMRFHDPDCPYGSRTGKRNRIYFDTRWEAHWAGFLPAGRCLASPIKKELKRR